MPRKKLTFALVKPLRMILVLVAVAIASASLIVSSWLTRDLRVEEQNKMEVWAEAMQSLNNADETTDINLVLRVLDTNEQIPIIVTDGSTILDSRNLSPSTDLEQRLLTMKAKDNCIAIDTPDGAWLVYYDDSLMLRRLALYPYVQMAVVLLFIVVAVFALLTSRRAEQNKVWVGLSKETAHQLGTPVSSMMAWTEVLREQYPDDPLIPELGNDVQRLQIIADRFSKIGSQPNAKQAPLTTEELTAIVADVVTYMRKRVSNKVEIRFNHDVTPTAHTSGALLSWVIENLCKNAVDAMEGIGTITITLFPATATTMQAVEVSDTGKGIPKKHLSTVFQPGFTTKQRGWGLGLSLAKRIVEEYHHGRIFVKHSELGVGTTFRIELP